MPENRNVEEKINTFLQDNKINVKGGQITTERQLSSILNNIAMSDLNKGKIEKAFYFTEKAIEFNKKNYYASFIQGLILRYKKEFTKAIDSFNFYYEKEKDSTALIYVGLCYAQLNDTEMALDYFRKGESEFSEKQKSENIGLMCTVYECIGNIYISKENILEFNDSDKLSLNYKRAEKYYRMSLKIDPKNSMLLNKLAACYYHFEDFGKALYCYEEAAKLEPNNNGYIEAIKELKESEITAEPFEF